MKGRIIALLASTAMLTACFPSKDISEENAEAILKAQRSVNQVSTSVQGSEQSSRISNGSLEQMLVRSLTTPVQAECSGGKGSVLFSKSESENKFSMVFDSCAGEDGGVLDGTVNGNFSTVDGVVNFDMNGNFDASYGSNSIEFNPVNFTFKYEDLAVESTQEGTFKYDTEDFKGSVTVKTEEPIIFDPLTLTYSGKVSYTDTQGNRLVVEYDRNGVQVELNGMHMKSYSHAQWIRDFS